MPLGLWNLPWVVQNSQRRYPLADDASGIDDTGSFTLPDDFLVGLDLPVPVGADVDPARFFVLTVLAAATGYGITIGYQPSVGDPVPVASALIPSVGFVRNTTISIGGSGLFATSQGKLTIGRLDQINRQPAGFWSFSLANSRLDPDAIRPMINGVDSLVCVNGDQESVALTGVIRLVAGNNVQLVSILVDGEDPVIRINAIDGEGTVESCVCDSTSPAIRRISGVSPTADGDFTLVGDECITVEPITNGLRLRDTCAAPCCGCAELEKITRALDQLGSQAATVEAFTNRLGNAVSTMNTVVLGSKLGDAGCVQCP